MRGGPQIILKIAHNAYVLELSVTKVLPKWYQSVTKPFNIAVYTVSQFFFFFKNEATTTEGRKSRSTQLVHPFDSCHFKFS